RIGGSGRLDESSRVLREHPGPKDVHLPAPRRARIDAHAGECFAVLTGSAWWRGTASRVSGRGRSAIHPIESDPLAGHDAVAADGRGTGDIVINQKSGVKGGASLLTERQVQFELTHPEIHQIIVVAEPDKPLEVIELNKGRFQVTVAGSSVEPGTAERRGEHD